MSYFVARLNEYSTWRGLSLLAAALGVVISQEVLTASFGVWVALVGLYDVVRKEQTL